MAYTEKDWGVVRAFYERGLSLAEIVSRPEVAITDRSSISKKAKSEGWIKNKKSTLVEKEIQLKHDVIEVQEEKSTLNSTELSVHNALVEERSRHIQFYDGGQNKLAQVALQKIEQHLTKNEDGKPWVSEGLSFQDINAAASVLQKSRDGVLGKSPDTLIQISNNGGSLRMTPQEIKEKLRVAGLLASNG